MAAEVLLLASLTPLPSPPPPLSSRTTPPVTMPMNIQSASTRSSRPPKPSSPPSPPRRTSASSSDRQTSELVVSQDFGEAEQATTTAEALNVQPERVELAPPESNEPSSSPTSLKLPLPPASPSQGSVKATTTPPTPGSTSSVATASTARTLDEFGLPRISPPRGYFDGDNEDVLGGASLEGPAEVMTTSTSGTE
ncbi:hypothetical protein JCM3765_003689 [Sporobolomyces pararoseus]